MGRGCPPEIPIMYLTSPAVLWLCIILNVGGIVIGSIGNILSYIVLGYRDRKSQSSILYLRSLAVADTAALSIGVTLTSVHMLWRPALGIPNSDYDHPINQMLNHFPVCNMRIYLSFCSYFVATYIIVLFSVERCLVVVNPLRWMNKFNARKAKIAVFIIVLLALLTQLPAFWSFKNKTLPIHIFNVTEDGSRIAIETDALLELTTCKNSTDDLQDIELPAAFSGYATMSMSPAFLISSKMLLSRPGLKLQCRDMCSFNVAFFKIFSMFHTILEFVIPFAVTSICNLLIFITLKRRSRSRMMPKSEDARRANEKQEKDTTKRLVLVSTAFLLLSLPYCIYHIVTKAIDNYCHVWAANLLQISMTLRSLNFAVNFFIYCLTERQFWKLVKAFISCDRRKLVRLRSYLNERPGAKAANALNSGTPSPSANKKRKLSSTTETTVSTGHHQRLLGATEPVLRRSTEDLHKYVMTHQHKKDKEEESDEDKCDPKECDLPKDGYDSRMFSEDENLQPAVVRWSEITPES